jgi:hypothetical protein
MATIIPLPTRETHPDAAARNRMDRLNRATTQEMHAALAFLDMIDPDAFEIAFQAVPPNRDEDLSDPGDPEPLCGRCGGPVALLPDRGMTWHHYRGAASTSGDHEVIDPGHEPKVEWYLPDEIPADF